MKLTIGISVVCLCARFDLSAAPHIDSDLTIIENRPANDPFGFPGLNLVLRANVSHADGNAALIGPPADASASSNNNNYPFTNPTPLPYLTLSASGNYFINLLPVTPANLPNVEGRYTYQVTDNDGEFDSLLSHNLNRTEVIPLPINLSVNNHTTTPVFSFTDPDPTPNVGGLARRYQLWILDANLNGIVVLPAGGLSNSPSVTVPAGYLCPCASYYFRAQSWDLDTGEGALENMSSEFLLFSATAVAPNADMTKDCLADGRDIRPFVAALINNSTAQLDLCPADFNMSGTIDFGDIPEFVDQLIGP